jgi:tetratricopeptide (TPR) repeat protein
LRIRILTVLLMSACALAGCAVPQTDAVQTADTVVAPSSDELPDLPIQNYLSARFAASEYDMSEAARYYRATLSDDPKNTDLLSAAFFYSTYAGDMDGAAKLAQQIIASSPADRTARLVLALTAIKQRNFAEARKQLAASQTGASAGLTASIFNSWAAAGQRDLKTAEADIKTLGALNGGAPLAAINRAFLLDVMDANADDVEAGYREALAQNPTNPRLIDSYGRILERMGRAKDASALYARFETNNGLAPVVRAGKARIAAGKKPDKLVHNAGEGAAEALVGIAANLSDPDSIEAAIFYLRMALYLRPNFDFASMILGARLEGIKKFDAANIAYAAIAKDSPYYRMAAIETAMNDARMERTDEAIAKLKSLVDANPKDVEVWTSLGDAYRNAERFSDAASSYDRAIAEISTFQQRDWSLFYSRAMARERNKNWPDAEADLKKALELSPNEPQVMNYLGYSWIEQGQNLTQALGMLEKARSLRPFDGYIVDSVGWAYYRLGRYEDAAQALQDAVQLVPGDPTVNDHLGDALWRVGRKLDARFQWNHALTFDPEPEERADIEKKLQSGLAVDDRRG